MVSCFISRIVILIFGTLYPAYASYKAVRTKNVKEYVKWMMYWIVFALFTSIETFTDLFLSFWFPFYYELKIITVIYLLSPATNGSSILYRKFVHPVLTKREQEIDDYIAKAKEQGYHTMLNLGSKGVTYATSLIMQTAIKGGGGLVSQLKKSYSLGDLSDDQNITHRRDRRDEVDHRRYEDPRLVRPPISGPNDHGLYFPEVDAIQRPLPPMPDEEYYGRFPSSEEASSGYSSGDPIYYGDHLLRTGSIGRVRTRASTRTALPKRGSLSEGWPTWSPGEINESQREPDQRFFIPLTHSSSLPVSFTALNNIIKSEYQQVFKGLNSDQLFALINSGTPSSPDSVREANISVVVSEVTEPDCGKDESSPVATENAQVVNGTRDEEFDHQVKKCVEGEEKAPTEAEKVEKFVRGEEGTSTEAVKVEKYGKYNKRPAPTPPIKPEVVEKSEEGPEEDEFVTPNASPRLDRKHSSSYANLLEEMMDENKKTAGKTGQTLVVPKKSSKSKKSKKLHLPKMSFSFWNQKSGKHSSGSENSSVASSENLAGATTSSNKTDLEYFIPLKGEPEKENRPTEEKQL